MGVSGVSSMPGSSRVRVVAVASVAATRPGWDHKSMAAPVLDLQPARVRVLFYCCDPVPVRVRVLDELGDTVDVSDWEWRAVLTTGRERFDLETYPDEGGVTCYLRGDESARIPDGQEFPFDVAGRQPTAGEGITVLSGVMLGGRRTGAPLRSDPDAVPAGAPVPA